MKKIVTFLILSSIFYLLVTPAYAEVIRGYDAQITVQKDGKIRVVEKINYDFGALYKHGIYRDIPQLKKNDSGKEFELNIVLNGITDEEGNSYSYSQSIINNKLNLKIGDKDRTITGVHTYTIDYTVSGALSYYSDHDELYWNITGTDWLVNQENVNGTVRLPEGADMSKVKTRCFVGTSGSTEENCKIISEVSATSVSAPLVESGRGLTIVVSFPKGLVAVLEPKPYTAFENTWYGMLILGILFGLLALIALGWYVILPIYIPVRWWLTGRDPRSQDVRVWYDAPKAKNRPLTPAETGSLVDETVDMKDIFGTLIQLAQKGYFQIVEDKKGEFTFVKKKEWKNEKGLMHFEKELLSGLFKSSDECRIKGKDVSSEMQTVTESLYKQMVADGFFMTDPQATRNKYFALGGVALFTGNIFLALVAFIFAKFMPSKTEVGAQQASIGKSLKTFLTSQERQLTFQADKQVMFEKLLPYAVAFGVEKIWANRFKDFTLTQPDWYVGQNHSTFNAMYFSSRLHSSVSTFSYSATPTRSSSGFSSGFSSGGGFSGGGGGGGGGGSW